MGQVCTKQAIVLRTEQHCSKVLPPTVVILAAIIIIVAISLCVCVVLHCVLLCSSTGYTTVVVLGTLYLICINHPFCHYHASIETGTHNQNIQVYDVATLQHECTLSGHIGIVTVLRVTESPYGVYMFSGSSDATVQVCHIHVASPLFNSYLK